MTVNKDVEASSATPVDRGSGTGSGSRLGRARGGPSILKSSIGPAGSPRGLDDASSESRFPEAGLTVVGWVQPRGKALACWVIGGFRPPYHIHRRPCRNSHYRLGGAADRIGACGVRNRPTMPSRVERTVLASRLPTLGIRDPDLVESRVAIDTNAILVERSARLSLRIRGNCRYVVRPVGIEGSGSWTAPRRPRGRKPGRGPDIRWVRMPGSL
jgi:hypothetical protein